MATYRTENGPQYICIYRSGTAGLSWIPQFSRPLSLRLPQLAGYVFSDDLGAFGSRHTAAASMRQSDPTYGALQSDIQ